MGNTANIKMSIRQWQKPLKQTNKQLSIRIKNVLLSDNFLLKSPRCNNGKLGHRGSKWILFADKQKFYDVVDN